jgi:hypothetical protein
VEHNNIAKIARPKAENNRAENNPATKAVRCQRRLALSTLGSCIRVNARMRLRLSPFSFVARRLSG